MSQVLHSVSNSPSNHHQKHLSFPLKFLNFNSLLKHYHRLNKIISLYKLIKVQDYFNNPEFQVLFHLKKIPTSKQMTNLLYNHLIQQFTHILDFVVF